MNQINAARRLQGVVLKDYWTVIAMDPRLATQTGGSFSVCYLVSDPSGKLAYLKALDFAGALQSPDPARAIESLVEQFNFERDLLDYCLGQQMSRVVRAVDHGTVKLGDGFSDVVQYIVFEPAEGDLRKLINGFGEIDEAWAVTIVHQTAVGLSQLHAREIAHQDLKPSNVLSFDGPANAKIADLGCASRSGIQSPRDYLKIPGARAYAAPELVFGRFDPDWRTRRIAPDLFQLGSLACFLYTGLFMLPSILNRLPIDFRPKGFGGNFSGSFNDALPFVQDAYVRFLSEVRPQFFGIVGDGVYEMMTKLCSPEPENRTAGGPKWAGTSRYSLAPFISRLANLAAKAQYSAKKKLRVAPGDYDAH